MIDRKACWIASALVAVMLTASLWRVSLLADWTQLPLQGGDGSLWLTSSAWLLVAPGAVLVSMFLQSIQLREVKASDESLQPWKKWGGIYLMALGAIMALLQTFVIAASLGFATPVHPLLFLRGMFVVSGLLLMVMSNAIPKLPWMAYRNTLTDIDRDEGARRLRLRGWFGVLLGLAIALTGLAPLATMRPAIHALVVFGWALGLFFYSLNRKQIR